MADVKSPIPSPPLTDEELRQGMELLFYAYRDFTREPDAILGRIGFGRAHHRVVHFVGRNPRITVSDLLKILRITKQSLSRVLRELIREDYIVQHAGTRDRRQRLLELTARGIELERQLSEDQRARIANAYRRAGPDAVEGYRRVMIEMVNDDDREMLRQRLG